MFSTIIDVPLAIVKVVANIDCISVGNPGYGIVLISTAFGFFGASISISLLCIFNLHPVYSNLLITGVICSVSTFFKSIFPFVAAAIHRNVPDSILSGMML